MYLSPLSIKSFQDFKIGVQINIGEHFVVLSHGPFFIDTPSSLNLVQS
jgi:hypothetical protein